jgi:type II secretory pathway component PulF
MANTFYYWFGALVIFILFSGSLIWWSLPNFSSKHRKYLENIPPFNMYRLMVGCGFMFALNSLSKAGYIQIDALEQMVILSRPYLRHRIEILMDLMADGRDLGEALIYSKLDFPDKQMVRELAIQVKYSENDALEILSNTLAEDGLATIRAQAAVLNTVVTMLVFSIIGFLYFAIFSLGMELGNVQQL